MRDARVADWGLPAVRADRCELNLPPLIVRYEATSTVSKCRRRRILQLHGYHRGLLFIFCKVLTRVVFLKDAALGAKTTTYGGTLRPISLSAGMGCGYTRPHTGGSTCAGFGKSYCYAGGKIPFERRSRKFARQGGFYIRRNLQIT